MVRAVFAVFALRAFALLRDFVVETLTPPAYPQPG